MSIPAPGDLALPILGLPRVATIATMASRLETFRKMLPGVAAQVDQVFVYLDGYAAVPDFVREHANVRVERAEEVGDLHASARFLCLKELATPSVVVSVDDDIEYPPGYVDHMVAMLAELGGRALVGVHGRIFVAPHGSYVRDAIAYPFAWGLAEGRPVHEVGTGTCAFVSTVLPLDPARWARTDMNDIDIAIEAQRRRLPRVVVPRPTGWLRAHAESQADSLWVRTQRDDTEQTIRMGELLAMHAAAPKGEGPEDLRPAGR